MERGMREDQAVMEQQEMKNWICPECGGVNTGRYCYQCGRPQNAPVRPQDVSVQGEDDRWKDKEYYPTIEEVRRKAEKHGPLREVEWSAGSHGMMMGDVSS